MLQPRIFRQPCLFCSKRYFSSAPANPRLELSGAVRSTSRRLVLLHGPDAPDFLHALTTNKVNADASQGWYAAFLTAKGRILHDVFIYPAHSASTFTSAFPAIGSDPAYIVDVATPSLGDFLKHVKRYKLRSKFKTITIDEGEWSLWNVWSDKRAQWTAHTMSSNGGDGQNPFAIDNRAPGLGRRVILPKDETPADDAPLVDEESYRLRRYMNGVPEGPEELSYGNSLPAESDLDFMGGIDFRKGCYMGQELTIRTHHTGVVRKRILPIQIYDTGAEPPVLDYDPSFPTITPTSDNITRTNRKGRPAGKFIASIGNIGLGLCRLEVMTDTVLTGEGASWQAGDEFAVEAGKQVMVKAFIPSWHSKPAAEKSISNNL